MSQKLVRIFAALLLAAVALPTVALGSVEAAEVVCDAGPSWIVSDNAELNQALLCYNGAANAGEYRITFDADIAGVEMIESGDDKLVTHPITQSGEGFSLVIDGAGNAITNSFLDTGSDHGLFLVSGSAPVDFRNMVMGPSTEVGLIVDGGLVRVSNSHVFDNFYGVLVRDGSLHIENSRIEDSIYGVEVEAGRVVIINTVLISHGLHAVLIDGEDTDVDIYASTINSNDGNGVRVDNGSVGISNSTIVGNGFGGFNLASVHAADGFVSVFNSTIEGAFGLAISTSGLGHIAVSSTIAVEECRGFVVNLGWNTGGCFDTAEFDNGPLIDNGCKVQAFNECARTRALPEGVPAIGGGQCADTVRFDVDADTYGRGELLTDQRGEHRKAVCDIGAFETEGEPMCDGQLVTLFVKPGVPLVGTAGSDVILGTDGDDVIDGGAGDDVICGGPGADQIIGGDGNDSLFGEVGADNIRGNTGADHIVGGDGPDRLLGGTGDDVILGGGADDYIGGFGGDDEISGGDGSDVIYGGFGADSIDGGEGDDVIRGLIGDDEINGGGGNDEIFGDRGNDILNGGSGNDLILGGNAMDFIDGGEGDDELHGGKADDTVIGGVGTDLCVGNSETVADTAGFGCTTQFGFP